MSLEEVKERYGFKSISIAEWRSPQGSVLPYHGGPLSPTFSPDRVAAVYKPVYRVSPYQLPDATDSEESDGEDGAEKELEPLDSPMEPLVEEMSGAIPSEHSLTAREGPAPASAGDSSPDEPQTAVAPPENIAEALLGSEPSLENHGPKAETIEAASETEVPPTPPKEPPAAEPPVDETSWPAEEIGPVRAELPPVVLVVDGAEAQPDDVVVIAEEVPPPPPDPQPDDVIHVIEDGALVFDNNASDSAKKAVSFDPDTREPKPTKRPKKKGKSSSKDKTKQKKDRSGDVLPIDLPEELLPLPTDAGPGNRMPDGDAPPPVVVEEAPPPPPPPPPPPAEPEVPTEGAAAPLPPPQVLSHGTSASAGEASASKPVPTDEDADKAADDSATQDELQITEVDPLMDAGIEIVAVDPVPSKLPAAEAPALQIKPPLSEQPAAGLDEAPPPPPVDHAEHRADVPGFFPEEKLAPAAEEPVPAGETSAEAQSKPPVEGKSEEMAADAPADAEEPMAVEDDSESDHGDGNMVAVPMVIALELVGEALAAPATEPDAVVVEVDAPTEEEMSIEVAEVAPDAERETVAAEEISTHEAEAVTRETREAAQTADATAEEAEEAAKRAETAAEEAEAFAKQADGAAAHAEEAIEEVKTEHDDQATVKIEMAAVEVTEAAEEAEAGAATAGEVAEHADAAVEAVIFAEQVEETVVEAAAAFDAEASPVEPAPMQGRSADIEIEQPAQILDSPQAPPSPTLSKHSRTSYGRGHWERPHGEKATSVATPPKRVSIKRTSRSSKNDERDKGRMIRSRKRSLANEEEDASQRRRRARKVEELQRKVEELRMIAEGEAKRARQRAEELRVEKKRKGQEAKEAEEREIRRERRRREREREQERERERERDSFARPQRERGPPSPALRSGFINFIKGESITRAGLFVRTQSDNSVVRSARSGYVRSGPSQRSLRPSGKERSEHGADEAAEKTEKIDPPSPSSERSRRPRSHRTESDRPRERRHDRHRSSRGTVEEERPTLLGFLKRALR